MMEQERAFNLTLYPVACVLRAVEDYSAVAGIRLEEIGQDRVKVICTSNSAEESALIMNEFSNYLLMLVAAMGGL